MCSFTGIPRDGREDYVQKRMLVKPTTCLFQHRPLANLNPSATHMSRLHLVHRTNLRQPTASEPPRRCFCALQLPMPSNRARRTGEVAPVPDLPSSACAMRKPLAASVFRANLSLHVCLHLMVDRLSVLAPSVLGPWVAQGIYVGPYSYY